jgi:type IV pilus assembly protein PilW
MTGARKPRQSGFGLIELMISMVLGLLVLGAAIAVFQSNQRTFSANEGQNRIQEGARAAYEMMSRDIRAAGGTACPLQADVSDYKAAEGLVKAALEALGGLDIS